MAGELEVLNPLDKEKVATEKDPVGVVRNQNGTVNIEASAAVVSAQTEKAGALATAYDGKYTWDDQAEKATDPVHQQLRAEAQATAAEKAAEVQKNALDAQKSVVAAAYGANQTAEKHGWTGGAITDMQTQLEYMKASVNADLYGQLELQKARLESGLAAAKFEYLAKREALALDLYKTAQENALAVADRTGVYISPEVQDMSTQMRMAQTVLDDPNATADEKARAASVKASISGWFSEYGISEAGVFTLNAIQTLLTEEYNDAQIEYLTAQTYQIRREADYAQVEAENSIRANGYIPIYDEEGNLSSLNPNSTVTEERIRVREYFDANEGAIDNYVRDRYSAMKNLADAAGLTMSEYIAKNGDDLDKWLTGLGYTTVERAALRQKLGAYESVYGTQIADVQAIINNGGTAADASSAALTHAEGLLSGIADTEEGTDENIFARYNSYQTAIDFLTAAKGMITDPVIVASLDTKIAEYQGLLNTAQTEYASRFHTFTTNLDDTEAFNARYTLKWTTPSSSDHPNFTDPFYQNGGMVNQHINVGVVVDGKIKDFTVEYGAAVNGSNAYGPANDLDASEWTVGEMRIVTISTGAFGINGEKNALVIKGPDGNLHLVERANGSSGDYKDMLEAMGYTGENLYVG